MADSKDDRCHCNVSFFPHYHSQAGGIDDAPDGSDAQKAGDPNKKGGKGSTAGSKRQIA